MFDIGWSELLVVAVVAIVVVGPKDLPDMLRNLGKGMRTVRRMASDFQGQFNEALKEAELDDVRDEFNRMRSSARDLTRFNDLPSMARDELRNTIEGPSTTSVENPHLPAALPEPQLPVMQEPQFDITPAGEPKPRRRAPSKPKTGTEAAKARPAKAKSTAAEPLQPAAPEDKAPAKPARKRAAKPGLPMDGAS
jgi:sec-independent protein translocase protein TatB